MNREELNKSLLEAARRVDPTFAKTPEEIAWDNYDGYIVEEIGGGWFVSKKGAALKSILGI